LNNHDIFILGAIILGGAIVIELYSNFSNPLIDYAPGTYSSLLTNTPQRFDYYKDGTIIGTYTYTLTPQTRDSQNLYTLETTVGVTYQDKQFTVNTTHHFLGETSHVGYTVDSNIGGVTSHIECVFLGGKVSIISTSQGRNQTNTITLPSNTILIDNNNPAHLELLTKSFTAEAGMKYRINVLIPQGATIQQFEFGVDTSHQFVNIGSKSYECVVAREPNFQITLYLYNGDLIQYKNEADGILIVKKMP